MVASLLLLWALQDLKQAPETLENPGVHGIGRRIDLAGLPPREAFLRVVAFTSTTCPLSKIYRPRLDRLSALYAARGVAFDLVDADGTDGRLAAALGARRTTDVFVLDGLGVLRYRGALDDQYGIGYARKEPSRSYVVDAIEALLGGRPVPVPATEAPGCLIETPSRPRTAGGPTFHRDVAPILLRRCAECHRPGEIGPFPLLDLADARSKAKTIRRSVEERRMPPWFADPAHGRWANDRTLPSRERETLLQWIDAGCPEGDPKEAPTRPAFGDGWAIGTPDDVWEIPAEVRIPAEGVIPYKYYTVRTRLKEDRWVRAIEVRPGARAVVHHVLVFVQYPRHRDGQPVLDGGVRNGYFGIMVPGERPVEYPEGMGKLIPAGSQLIFQMHYTASGREAWDRTAIGVKYWSSPPAREVYTRGIANTGIKIPPGAAEHRETADWVFEHDARIIGFMPHTHVRGKSFRYEATYPDGRTRILLDLPRYDFNWQFFYPYREPLRVPKGTRIRATAVYDNSAANPANPDATKTVRFGEQTWDEMLIGYMDFVKD